MPLALLRRRAKEPRPPVVGPIAWRPFPTAGDPAGSGVHQIGVYGADRLLNQYPARWDDLQKFTGVEGLSSRWFTPSRSPLLNEQQTQRPGNAMPAMLWGSIYSGPTGPVNVKAMQQRVLVGQVQQSGVSAVSWAKGLSPYGAGNP